MLQEALVQDYDGLLRIAPAWPKQWDVDGTVYIQHKSKVDVQIRGGALVTVAIEAGATGHLRVRNPWPGEDVEVVSDNGERRTAEGSNPIFDIAAQSGRSYFIQPSSETNAKLSFPAVDGAPASHPKSLGTRHIGLTAAQ